MQAFLDNARVELGDQGLRFYEKDILMCKYMFNRSLRIEVTLDYNRSGFGIIICNDEDKGPMNSAHRYLFHQGSMEFSVIERHRNSQSITRSRSNILSPGQKIKIRLDYRSQKVRVYLLEKGSVVYEDPVEIGDYYITRKMKTYYVGFYSQAGNLIREACFYQGIPDLWHSSIKNTHGGRIMFFDDGFQMEGSVHDSEIEQQHIKLDKGYYWFSYEKEDLDDQNDIEGFVYPSYIPARPAATDTNFKNKWDAFDGRWFEDQGKDLTDDDGCFYLESDTDVTVSFKGTHGKIRNIMINDNSFGNFMSTGNEAVISDGSWIEVDLTDITKIEWDGIIYDVPSYTNLTVPCPYGIVVTSNTRLQLGHCRVNRNEEYHYTYSTAGRTLRVNKVTEREVTRVETDTVQITDLTLITIDNYHRDAYQIKYSDTTINIMNDSTDTYVFRNEDGEGSFCHLTGSTEIIESTDISIYKIVPREVVETQTVSNFVSSLYVNFSPGEKSIKIFKGVSGQIKNMKLYYDNGNVVNINLRRIYPYLVDTYINGPIIVTDENGNSFDLCSSYREVVDLDAYHIDLFSKTAVEMKLTYNTTDLAYDPQVYGIHKGVSVDDTKTDIEDFVKTANGYTEIHNFTLEDGILTIPEEIKKNYSYIAIRYQRADQYHYWFSVYEREVFSGEEDILKLGKTINESGADLYVYGIPGNDNFREEYLMRVPSNSDTIFYTSIDLCAKEYDLISPYKYDVDTEDSQIYLKAELRDKYQYYIVDYLKYDSYTINEDYENKKYVLGIVSDRPKMYVNYEMDEDHNSSKVHRTDISDEQNKFIILKRKEGYPYED